MIRIIEVPEHKIQCDSCGCIFTFEKEDLHFRAEQEWGIFFPKAVRYNFVICPFCSKRLKMYF